MQHTETSPPPISSSYFQRARSARRAVRRRALGRRRIITLAGGRRLLLDDDDLDGLLLRFTVMGTRLAMVVRVLRRGWTIDNDHRYHGLPTCTGTLRYRLVRHRTDRPPIYGHDLDIAAGISGARVSAGDHIHAASTHGVRGRVRLCIGTGVAAVAVIGSGGLSIVRTANGNGHAVAGVGVRVGVSVSVGLRATVTSVTRLSALNRDTTLLITVVHAIDIAGIGTAVTYVESVVAR